MEHLLDFLLGASGVVVFLLFCGLYEISKYRKLPNIHVMRIAVKLQYELNIYYYEKIVLDIAKEIYKENHFKWWEITGHIKIPNGAEFYNDASLAVDKIIKKNSARKLKMFRYGKSYSDGLDEVRHDIWDYVYFLTKLSTKLKDDKSWQGESY